MKKIFGFSLTLLNLIFICSLFAEQNHITQSSSDLRMRKRFGFGGAAAGGLGVMGILADINISDDQSLQAGIGTGLEYSTYMIKYRHLILAEHVHPYFGISYSLWSSSRAVEDPSKITPGFISTRFLSSEEMQNPNGWSLHLIAPLFGVQYLHPSGFSIFTEINLLTRLIQFTGQFYWSLGVIWYL